jgi:hypothetical protein
MLRTRLGPYEIVAKLGEGGMGEVTVSDSCSCLTTQARGSRQDITLVFNFFDELRRIAPVGQR